MPENREPLRITEMPQRLLSEMNDMIHTFSTCLIKVSADRNGEETMALIGSGSFVTVGDIAGILTAEHVVRLFEDSSFNGPPKFLGLAVQKYEHKCVIEHEYVKILRIARGKVDSEGPDLAFIGIPPGKLASLRAIKSFFDLHHVRNRMLSSPPEPDLGIWAICGAPDIETTNEQPSRSFSEIKAFRSYCFFGGISRIYQVEKYDYLDIEAKYDCDTDIPESFGGISGGGVWQVPLIRMPNGEMKPQEYLLSGVAFYQTERLGLSRSIRCHARKSIYDIAYAAIERNGSGEFSRPRARL